MKKTVLKTTGLALLAGVLVFSSCQSTPRENPYVEGTTISKAFLDSSLTSAVQKGFFPGAQLIIGNRDTVLYEKTYGWHDYSKKDTVKPQDVYDMASCSKVLGTTVAVMKLAGEGRLSLSDQVGQVLPQFAKTPIADLTLLELLTHTTGMKPFIPFYMQLLSTEDGKPVLSKDSSENYPARFGDMFVNRTVKYDPKYVSAEPKEGYVQVTDKVYLNPDFYGVMDKQIAKANTGTRGKYMYSDLNLILVQRMVEARAGMPQDRYLAGIYKDMGLSNIGYKPLEWTALANTVPTEVDNVFRRDTIHGYAHDEVAALLGNVAGHAGLFSNAEAAAALCQMFLNRGQYNGKQVLKGEVVDEFTATPLLDKGVYRGIGFDKRKPGNGVYGDNSYGHTGFTGTFFWVDPDKDIYLVLLTNRVHPTRDNGLMYDDDFRPKLWKHITANAAPENAAEKSK